MNKVSFVIPGMIRIKKNSRRIFGKGRKKTNLPSEAYMEWESSARNRFIMMCRAPFPVFACNCHVQAVFYYTGQEFDLSGALESIGDCFEKLLWKNDRQIVSWDGSRKYRVKDNPRVEIMVEWDL